MVSEMPTSEEVEKIFAEFVAKKDLLKSDKDFLNPEADQENTKNIKTKSINDILTGKELSVGLNDRLAFVKHLFDGNKEYFDKAITQLNEIDSEERSLAFVENLVKPEFDNWTGQQEYEKRFIDLIKRRFA